LVSNIPSKPEYVLYQALYDYNSGDPDDLQFEASDILQVTDEGNGPSSWMIGSTQDGREGNFPSTYVRKMNIGATKTTSIDMNDDDENGNKAKAATPSVKMAAVAPPAKALVNPFAQKSVQVNPFAQKSAPVVQTPPSKPKPAGRVYVLYQALYAYNSGDADDLVLEANDIVRVFDEGDGSGTCWMEGESQDGKEGNFPGTYVRKINMGGGRAKTVTGLEHS